jgi:hypothetical protein
MILGLNISKLGEVLQYLSTKVMALFRMKLHTVDIAGVDRATELDTVLGGSCDIFLPRALKIVGVQKVEARFGIELIE